jgi:cell wall-associated NlpC family hydrolase
VFSNAGEESFVAPEARRRAVHGERHPRERSIGRLGITVATLIAGLLLVGTATPAGALPPEPYNPSDDEIQQGQNTADAAAAEVGRLSGLVTTTEGEIQRLQSDMELKAELAMKAKIDLQLAQDDAAAAASKADKAKAAAVAAGEKIVEARQKAAEFAAASFRQGSVLGSMTALIGSDSPGDLLDRDELLEQVSASQLDVIQRLQDARNAKANKDSDARVALNEAVAAQNAADQAKKDADAAEATATQAFADGKTKLADLQTQLTQQQQAYQTALNSVSSLQAQRDQYEQWLAEKKAEEERLRKEAEERARKAEEARKAAEAAAAKAAAERAEREHQAAVAAAKAAAQKAAAERAAKEAAEKAAAERAAKQRAAKIAAAKAAAVAAANKRAADAAAAKARAEAEAAAEKVRKDRARAEAARRAAEAKAEREAAAATEAARRAKAAKDAADSAQKAVDAIRGKGTGSGSYFQDCDAARAAGAAPMKKGEPGYRKELDPNGNGIACDGGISTGGGSSGGSVTIPSDGSRGATVVNAALAYLGTTYAWGGGDASGPTLGVRDGGVADAYGDYMKVGFDCSGLALYAWAQVGVSLPHYSGYQYFSGQHVPVGQLEPGDLVFYANNTSDPGTIHHVAIYMGNNQIVEAPQSGSVVKISTFYRSGFIGATRPGT